MPGSFAWVPDVARGEWLRPMEAEPFSSTLSIVPRGFEAYARIFHSVERDRPRATGTWLGVDTDALFDGVTDLDAAIETGRSTWAEVAGVFGTTMHGEAQYTRLVGLGAWDTSATIGPDGWRYEVPPTGSCDLVSFTSTAAVLARHTTTPSTGVAAVWVGWGGLMSSAGYATLTAVRDDAPTSAAPGGLSIRSAAQAVRRRLAARAHRARRSIRAKIMIRTPSFRRDPEPGSGLLPRDVASGPTFDLHGGTGRAYVLFEAGARDLADPSWTERAPWVRHDWSAQTPSMVWPDDHAWFLATEIDYDSTLVAGSAELVRELIETPGLEVLAIDPGADLTLDGDTVNPVV